MKNKEYKKLIAIVTAMALTVGTVCRIPFTAYAAEPARKVETVYAQISEDGTVTSTTVSDQLKNVSDDEKIKDVSSLSDIENVKGDETFTEKDGSLIWDGDKKDICYQGTSTQSLPVGMKISYTLDGKAVSAEELKGKSGHLVIRYDYENTSMESAGAYIPFLMVTGLLLDSDHFTNVSLTNGKLVSDGERDIAIGMGIPGLKEDLGVEDLAIPDYFEVSADVKDYDATESITVATNDLFNSLDTEQFDSISELKDAMSQLEDAANQLVSGSGALREGLDTLLKSSGTLEDGIGELADGGRSLSSGTGQLLAGANTLKSGSDTLNAGLQSASESTSGKLLPGVQSLDNGVTAMQKQLSSGMTELVNAVRSLDNGLNQPASAGAASLKDGAASVSSALNDQLAPLSGQLSGNAKALADAMTSVPSVNTSAYDVANGNGETDTALQSLTALLSRDDVPDDVKASIQTSIAEIKSDKSARDTKAKTLDSEIQAMGNALSGISADTKDLAQQVLTEAQTLQGGLTQAAAASSQVSGGINQAAAGASALNSKVSDPDQGLTAQVSSALSQLKSGTSTLRGGIEGTGGLAEGLKQLSGGASQMHTGLQTFTGKLSTANDGAAALSGGIGRLQSGSSALISGVKQLDAGAKELNDGMIQFNEDGIQKLTAAFDGDIDGLLDKVNDMLSASRNYNNFSGISDDMEGEVKFIFLSDK